MTTKVETCWAIIKKARADPRPTTTLETSGEKQVKVLAKCNNALIGIIDFYSIKRQYADIIKLFHENIKPLMKVKSLCIAPYVFIGVFETFVTVKVEQIHGFVQPPFMTTDGILTNWYAAFSEAMDSVRAYYLDRLLITELCNVLRSSNSALFGLQCAEAMLENADESKALNDMLLRSIPMDIPIISTANQYDVTTLLKMMNKCCVSNKIMVAPKELEVCARTMIASEYRSYHAKEQLWCCVLSDLRLAIETKTKEVPALVYFPKKKTDIERILSHNADMFADLGRTASADQGRQSLPDPAFRTVYITDVHFQDLMMFKTPYEAFLINCIKKLFFVETTDK